MSTSFQDFYLGDNNVTPAERAKIEFEVELIGKLIEIREASGLSQKKLAEMAGGPCQRQEISPLLPYLHPDCYIF